LHQALTIMASSATIMASFAAAEHYMYASIFGEAKRGLK